MLSTGFLLNGPAAVRYPRGTGPGVAVDPALEPLPVGKAEIRRTGKRVALLAFGSMLAPALEAGEAFGATVVNMRFVKPLDEDLIQELARTHELLITVEENVVAGGAGGAVNEFLVAAGLATRVVNLGLPDRFIEHGDHRAQLARCGLDAAGIRRAILRHVATNAPAERETA
jgi:1-deoxy-D-xylulose-5-phosphate synthase